MDKFPITLERVVFTRTVVVAMPDHRASGSGTVTSTPANSIEVVPMPEGQRRYMVRMQTRVNLESDPIDPYLIDMECIGFFLADDTLSDEDAIRGVTITGHSVLLGAIRESVAWITGRHPHGPLILGLSVLQHKEEAHTEKRSQPPAKGAPKAGTKVKKVA